MDPEDYGWAELIEDWLQGQKIHAVAAYYQNEMIFADFFSQSRFQVTQRASSKYYCNSRLTPFTWRDQIPKSEHQGIKSDSEHSFCKRLWSRSAAFGHSFT